MKFFGWSHFVLLLLLDVFNLYATAIRMEGKRISRVPGASLRRRDQISSSAGLSALSDMNDFQYDINMTIGGSLRTIEIDTGR